MQVVIPGNNSSFSVVVADTSGVTYQWFFNSTAIPGATGDSLLLTNVSTANEGPYWVAVSNALGSVASVLANLYIDSRGNGMPDSWQLEYFGNLNQNPLGDYDGDGVSNLQEFLDGTNPTNAASALYHLTLANDGGTVLVSPDQPTYTNGQLVTLTASGSSSAPFHAWTGDVVTRSNSITVTMTTNRTLFAHFLPFTMVWTNQMGGDWNVAANWSPNLVPSSNESVILGGGSQASSGPTITENSNVDLVDLTIGNSLFIPVLTGSGRITISGTCIWNSGTMGGTGATVVLPGASLSLNSSGLVMNRTLENAGSMVLGGTSFFLGGVLTNDVGAQFLLLGPAYIGFNGGSSRFDNAGLFVTSSSAGVTSFAGVPFNNFGTVQIQAGTLALLGGGTDGGVITVPAGTTLNLAGGVFTSSGNPSITGAGNFLVSGASGTLGGTVYLTGSNVFSGGSVDFTGTYILTNAPLPISGCTVSFDGTSLVAPTVLTLSSGGMGGSTVVTVSNAMNWSGGSLAGTGRIIIPAGATLNITNTSPLFLTSYTLENGGSATWSGTSLISMNGGVITNDTGASFNIQSPVSLSWGGDSPRFDNAGVVRAAPGAGTINVTAAFNNYNDTQIQSGTLQLGGGLNNGTIEVAAGTTLALGGAFNASPASSISGGGAFTVNGGSDTLAGLINVTGTNAFNNGATELSGNYICTNNTLVLSGGAANFDGPGPVSPLVLNVSGGTFGGSQRVTVGSVMNWTGGSLAGTGRIIIPAGATLNITNTSPLFLTSYTLENGGSATWSGTSLISMNGGVITNDMGASFNIQSPVSLSWAGGSPRFDNAGVVRAAPGAGTINVTAAFNNYNDTQIQSGTLQLGGGLNNGTIEVPAGTTLALGGAFNASPTSSISGGGAFTVNGGSDTLAGLINVTGTNAFNNGATELNGAYTCTNNALTISGGTVSFDGSGPVSPSVLNLSNGSLGGTNVVSVLKVMSWTGGSLNGTGRTVIAPGATLNIAGVGPLIGNNRTLENGGTAFWTGAGSLSLNGNIFTNRVGALFNVQNASAIDWGGGSPRFDNAGTFRKSVSSGTTAFDSVNFTNYGLVDLQSGVLQMNNSVYASLSNSVLRCLLAGKIPGTNFGRLQVAAPGAVTLNGALNVALANGYLPATNDTFTLLTAGTRNGAFTGFSYPSNQVTMVLNNNSTSVVVQVTGVAPLPPAPLLSLPQVSGSNVTLTWTAISNLTYRLEFNPDLTPSNWNAVPGDVTSTGNVASKLDSLTSSNRFYRIRLIP